MKINAIDIDGKLKQYDAILTYHNKEYNKDYIVYTDNVYNENDELQIYISACNLNDIETTVKPIENTLEYEKIKTEIDIILSNIKSEEDKLESSDFNA